MKGILVKTDKQEYRLYTNDSLPFATTDNSPYKKLSLKNCEAIENGYDLDELAKADADLRYNQPGEEDLWLTRVTGIEYGFNLALEILGNKKYSEDDIIDCWETAHQAGRFEEKGIAETNWQTAINYAQSLQQTEWEVEVVMDRIPADLAPGGWDVFPKLDTDGCLILKIVE